MGNLGQKLRDLAPFLWLDGDARVLPRPIARARNFDAGSIVDGRAVRCRIVGDALVSNGTGFLEDCLIEEPTGPVDLRGGQWLRSIARGIKLTVTDAAGFRASICDLSESRISGALGSAHLQFCSLRAAQLEKVDLVGTQLLLCEFPGARLVEVDLSGASLHSCDLGGALFRNVCFDGADLSGSSFAFARFENCSFEGVRAAGVELRGAMGLGEEERATLIGAGATQPSGPLQRTLGGLAARLVGPGSRAEFIGLWTTRLLVGTGVLVVPVWLAVQAVQHASGDESGGFGRFETGEPASFGEPYVTVTPEVEQEAQVELERVRADIATFHERNGRYPTLAELEENRGPGGLLIPAGQPSNPLTTNTQGWVEYCDAQPKQSHLTGDDNDWHYCPDTGAVYACGGFSTSRTASW